MRKVFGCFLVAASLLSASELVAQLVRHSPPQLLEIQAYLFDEAKGVWDQNNLFDQNNVPTNQFAVPMLVVATIDYGPECIIKELSSAELQTLLKSGRGLPTRPATCEKIRDILNVKLKYKNEELDRQQIPLSKFFVGYDGRVRVPILIYRRHQCTPLGVTVRVSSGSSFSQQIEFSCNE
jgi:hypothetical protein